MTKALWKNPVLVFSLCLLPWLLLQPQIRISADAAWLIGAAQKFLAGQSMTAAFYDDNPPLSYMIYTPVALLARTGLPVWYALPVFTMMLTACSLFVTAGLLRGWAELDTTRRMALLAAFAVAVTLPAQVEFGQKDHLIALTLLPFLLAQDALTRKLPVSRHLIWLALLLGTPFILLKPHYGLLPVLLLLDRARREKRVSVLFDADGCILIGGVLLYAVAIFLWFPDFVHQALRFSASFYASRLSADVFPAAFGLGLLSACLLLLAWVAEKSPGRGAALFLTAMALAAVIPLLAQLKGFSLHMLPPLSLLIPAAVMTLSLYTPRWFEQPPALVALLIFVAGYVAFPLALNYPRHADYARAPLAAYLRQKAPGGSFFMQSDSTNAIVPVSLYTGIPVASRFPCLWFLPAAAGNAAALAIFATDIAQDLNRFKPSFVAIYADPAPGYDFLKLFSGNPAFAKAWALYQRQDKFQLNYAAYSNGQFKSDQQVVDYDVYVRTANP